MIRRICQRHRLSREDAEDFNSFALLKLIEDDYARLRSFQGRSRLKTFLTVVLHRLFLDYRFRNGANGAPPQRSGNSAPPPGRPHRLVNRDGQPLPDAVEIVFSRSGGALSREHLLELAGRLPQRQRPRVEEIERLDQIPSHSSVDETLDRQERGRIAQRVSSALARALRELPAEDRLILKMRHEDGFTVRDIAKLSISMPDLSTPDSRNATADSGKSWKQGGHLAGGGFHSRLDRLRPRSTLHPRTGRPGPLSVQGGR